MLHTYPQIRSYSTLVEEIVRDYVLACHEKLSTETLYDSYIITSELIIALGSLVLYVVLCFKWSQDAKTTDFRKLCDLKRPCSAQQCVSLSASICSATLNCGRKIASLLLVVNVSAAIILALDFVQISINHDRLGKWFFSYSYSSLNTTLFGLTIIALTLTATIGCPACMYSLISRKSKFRWKCEKFQILLLVSLTAVSFSYVVTRAYMVSLLIATYPFEVGFIVLAIGSVYIALIFVILTAVHIVVFKFTKDSQARMYPAITVLIPYICLLVILIGLMISYIGVILRLNIRVMDPVTALVAALVPTAIGFVAANRFEAEKRSIERFRNGPLEASMPPTTEIPVEDAQGTSLRSTKLDTRTHSGEKCRNFPLQTVPVSLSEMDIQQLQEESSH